MTVLEYLQLITGCTAIVAGLFLCIWWFVDAFLYVCRINTLEETDEFWQEYDKDWEEYEEDYYGRTR